LLVPERERILAWRRGYYMARGLGPHAAFLLHQATERYFHAVLLVYTGYKPRTHDIEGLAKQTAPFHSALEGALPRVEPEDQRLFSLLKRAYIEARYSKSYRLTPAELVVLRERVLDLAVRVRAACADRLATISEDGTVGELPEVPLSDHVMELPAAPRLDDPKAVEVWRDALVRMSYERGERLRREGEAAGHKAGLHEGEARERARAIVDALRRRGVILSDEEADGLLACRDEATLAGWWDLAWSARSAQELLSS
jgi:HEPN domain-containing protein